MVNKLILFTIFPLIFAFSTLPYATAQTKGKETTLNPWAELKAPLRGADGKPEVFGGYSNGCVRNAHEVAVSNKYWEMVNLQRGRNFGHPDVVPLLQHLGEHSLKSGYGKLIIGDISQPAGGPMAYGHASHQMGLDVDIRFDLAKAGERMADEKRKDYPQDPVARHVVAKQLGTYQLRSTMVEKRWRNAYADLLEKAANYPQTERIFVSPPIKKALCDLYKDKKGGYPAWLLKIIPYHGHDAHFHVRLACPKDSKGCKPQAAIKLMDGDPSKVGCEGPGLKWWFDPSPDNKDSYMADSIAEFEAASATDDGDTVANKLAKLPQECKNLIQSTVPVQSADKSATEATR